MKSTVLKKTKYRCAQRRVRGHDRPCSSSMKVACSLANARVRKRAREETLLTENTFFLFHGTYSGSKHLVHASLLPQSSCFFALFLPVYCSSEEMIPRELQVARTRKRRWVYCSINPSYCRTPLSLQGTYYSELAWDHFCSVVLKGGGEWVYYVKSFVSHHSRLPGTPLYLNM